MQSIGAKLVKNSAANIARGSASAIVAIVLPHFLARMLDRDRFAGWALMLQVAACANYLDFGIQTAVARFLAQAIERADAGRRDKLISTAFTMLVAGGLLGVLAIGAVIACLPRMFVQAPADALGELRAGIAMLALCTVLQLPLSTFTGILIGLCRNELPAFAVVASRLAAAVGVVIAIGHTQSLVVLAGITGGLQLAGSLAQYFMARRLLPDMRVECSLFSRSAAAELAQYCGTLTVWSLCMLLVSGLDLTIVGHYDFEQVGPYSIAAMLITFLVGIDNSVYGALLAPLSVLHAQGELRRIGSMVVNVTWFTNFLDIGAILAVFLCGRFLLTAWVGESYAARALPILKILVIAHSIRLAGAPMSAALVATNQQHHGIAGAAIEGVSNFALSVGGAIGMGAIGVAWGTAAGSCIGVLWMFLFMFGRMKTPLVSRRILLLDGCLRPAICLLPVILCALALDSVDNVQLRSGIIVMGILATAAMVWRWGWTQRTQQQFAA